MKPDRTALVFSEYSSGHETGSHPENQSRLDALSAHLEREGLLADRAIYSAEPAARELVERAHDTFLIDTLHELCERGGGAIDGDTFVAPGSCDAAYAAVGAAIRAVDLVLSGDHLRAFSMVRPPGHHAERSRQMGFCLFNNVAIAAMYAMSEYGISRVAIIDWDVHHGNGTQDIFYDSSDVLFCSIHQWPLFPGTGLEGERGTGPGEGYTFNVPLPAGSTENDYLTVMDQVIVPAVHAFAPELILVSAGFDAHRDDPLAMMSVSEHGFAQMAERVADMAEELTNGQLALTLEGGYNLQALSGSVVAVLNALDERSPGERSQI